MLRRILLGIGGTPFSEIGIRRAVEIAKHHQATITAIPLLDEKRLSRIGPVPLGAGEAASDLRQHRRQVTREQIQQALDQFTEAARTEGVVLHVLEERRDPLLAMIDHSRYHDLHIFGLRSMFEYDILGDVSADPAVVLRDLVTGGVRPLLAVSDKYRTIRRVLVAYSGSLPSADSLRQFLIFQLWPDAVVRVLVCQHPQDQAEKLALDAAAYCQAYGYQVETCYRPEDPKTGILAEVSEWEADLVVMGSSVKSWLSQALFETVFLHVVRNVDRPIFIGV
jgi:nucleotide-binding universal stress UspA family protein